MTSQRIGDILKEQEAENTAFSTRVPLKTVVSVTLDQYTARRTRHTVSFRGVFVEVDFDYPWGPLFIQSLDDGVIYSLNTAKIDSAFLEGRWQKIDEILA